MTMLDNIYVIVCAPEKIKPVVEIIRPILNGGTCYISDAMEIAL